MHQLAWAPATHPLSHERQSIEWPRSYPNRISAPPVFTVSLVNRRQPGLSAYLRKAMEPGQRQQHHVAVVQSKELPLGELVHYEVFALAVDGQDDLDDGGSTKGPMKRSAGGRARSSGTCPMTKRLDGPQVHLGRGGASFLR